MSGSDGRWTVHAGIESSRKCKAAKRTHVCRAGQQEVPSLQEPLRSEQLATEGARDDVTQSTPALLVFRLMIAMCAAGLLGVNSCSAVCDISVA